MARKHGKSGQVLMDLGGSPGSPVGGSPYAPVAVGDINAWTLSMKTDRVDVTCFGDTNKQRVAGLPDYSGTVSGFWNPSGTIPTIIAAVLAGDTVFLRLMPDTADTTNYFEGLANLDADLDCSATGAVTFKGTWDAAGNWTQAA